MIRVPAALFRIPYERPFDDLLEAGFGSQLEMECLNGLIRGHLEKVRRGGATAPPKLFEIGTHRGAGICHFHAMAPDLEIHSLNVLPEQLAHLPRQMPGEVISGGEIGRFAVERGIAFTQHLCDSRTFDWEALAEAHRFDIVFIDGCHEQCSVMADTLNALRILQPDGLLIWHDFKVIDEPGRQVFAAVNDLDDHEFAGQVRHIEGTWLAFAGRASFRTAGVDAPVREDAGAAVKASPRRAPDEEIAIHLAHERRIAFAAKVRELPEVRRVVFFSDHRNPVWPPDDEMSVLTERYQTTRDPRHVARADIVIFHLPQVPCWHLLPKRGNQIWVGVTMEPDGYQPAQADPRRLATLDLLLSYHAHADVRLNFSYPGSLAELAAAPGAKDPDKLVCAVISNPSSLSGRERLVERLERLLPVHHFGKWRRNRSGPRLEGRDAKLEILRQYHFCLALENFLQADYVSEKWYDCFVAGCVPVYFGAPNIDEYSPGPGAFLNVRTFGPLEKLAEAIKAAAADRDRYSAFFEWKGNPRPAFLQLYSDEVNRLPLLAKLERAIHAALGAS
jgi:hypothetical protein